MRNNLNDFLFGVTTMIRKGLILVFTLMVVLLLSCFLFVSFGIRYIDDKYGTFPRHATRVQVQNHLRWFSEKKVDQNDIAKEYQMGLPDASATTVYRYTFISYPLIFHVFYNEKMEVVLRVPDYE